MWMLPDRREYHRDREHRAVRECPSIYEETVMYTITEKVCEDIRTRILEGGREPGIKVRIYVCPNCGSYAWSNGGSTGFIFPSCDDGRSEEPVFMMEEDMTL